MTGELATIASAFAPRPVVYRTMDFRTNEFRNLEGGEEFEPHEENPMIGFRGCYRYVKDPETFALELEALAHGSRAVPQPAPHDPVRPHHVGARRSASQRSIAARSGTTDGWSAG